jgi:hypothetical protein
MASTETITWNCHGADCAKAEFADAEFREHLRKVHDVQPGGKGVRELQMHLRHGRGRSTFVYKWTLRRPDLSDDLLVFYQSVALVRK